MKEGPLTIAPKPGDDVRLGFDPIESIAGYLRQRSWGCTLTESAVLVSIASHPCDCHARYLWLEAEHLLHFSLCYEQKIPFRRRRQVEKLVLEVNKMLNFGSFQAHCPEHLMVFTAALPLEDGEISDAQIGYLLSFGLDAVEAYAYFFRMASEGKSASEALAQGQMHLSECVGSA